MKKNFIILPLVCALLYIVLSSYSFGAGSGASVEGTGATGAAGCSCHNASATSSTLVSIQVLDAGSPVTTYTGGHAYTIRLTGTQSSSSLTLPRFGFQLSAVRSGTTSNAGTLTAAVGTHTVTVSGIRIVEQSSALAPISGTGGSGTTYQVDIPWTAPASGSGCITIYGTINAVNYNGTDDAGDKWNNTSITISEPLASITGTTSACVGNTSTLADATGCGTWSSSNTSIATVGTSGVVTGVSAGTATISYNVGTSSATTTFTVNPLPTAILGTTTVCQGGTTPLSDITPGGTWTSVSTGVATIGTTGLVTGISGGTSVISYTAPPFGCSITTTVTVNALPLAITGPTSVCVGNTVTLLDATSGGTWSSSNSNASIGSASGIVTGNTVGTSVITYMRPTGCFVTTTMTVNPIPGGITGTLSVCPGATTTLVGPTGGTWSSSDGSIAVVGSSSGIVTGINSGSAVITYLVSSTGCFTTATVNVLSLPAPISGFSSVCIGGTTTLTDGTGGGTWSTSDASVATIGSTSGLVTGVTAGSATITYTASTGCFVTTTMTVNPPPPGISGLGAVCVGSSATLTNSAGSGTWASSSTSTATINIATGSVTGVAAGITTITFTLSSTGCTTTRTETVNPLPPPISGTGRVCIGATTTVTNSGGAGTWSSSNTALATIGSATGTITGIAAGTVFLSYTLSSTGCTATATETVSALPPAISGATNVCVGSSATLTSSGGTWSSGDASIATIGSSTGLMTGISAGNVIISYTSTTTGCFTTRTETVNPLPGPIVGGTALCVGSTLTLTETTTGGTWSSSNAAIASIGSISGIVTGNSSGNAVITYSAPTTGCRVTTTITVNTVPAAIGGSTSICAGATTTLTDASGGGLWSSSNTSVATIGSSSGLLSGVSAGTVTITYTLGSGCAVTRTETITAAPASIAGVGLLCTGHTITLTNTTSGGIWTSGSTAIATVGSTTGIVTGIASGTATISYTIGGCRTTATVTVSPISPITGLSSMCAGTTTTLSDATAGGTWSSSDITVASIGATSGSLTAIASGTATITYTMASGCTATTTITVISAPPPISGSNQACIGSPVTLTDAGGGTWTSSSTSTATVGSTTGIVTGVTTGPVTITYSLGSGCTTTLAMTVNTAPAGITGTPTVCEAGGTTTLSSTTTGGTWSSSNANATVGLTTGVVTGVTAGTSVITYTAATGCFVTRTVTINPLPAAIGGIASVCVGASTTLTDATGGGTWSTSSASTATISATTGIVGGASAGTATISYTIATGCRVTTEVTVNPLPATIGGTTGICVGGVSFLTDASTGGAWSSSSATITIGSSSGVVAGLSAGTGIVTYTLPTGCRTITTITVNPSPAPISGTPSLCEGGTSILTTTTVGGAWSSSDATVASVGSFTGVVTGAGAGTATITYTAGGAGCFVTRAVTVNPAPNAITGASIVCIGASTTLVDATTGGTWISSSTTVATIGSTTGSLTGVSAGTATITYKLLSTGCFTTASMSVSPPPALITGPSTMCLGSIATYSNSVPGGTWSTSDASVATIGSSSGIATPVSTGTIAITYSLGTSCYVWRSAINVSSYPAAIAGPSTVCAGNTITLTDATTSGTWSSSATGTATVGSTSGLVTGVAGGTAVLSYTAAGCSATTTVTVNPTPATISGASTACVGVSITLTDASSGGTWSSSATGTATIGSASGIVTGMATGNAVITYTLPTGCLTTKSINVATAPTAGTLSGTTHQCIGVTGLVTSTVSGGRWSSANVSVATVGSSSGITNGIAAGFNTLTYTVTNACGTATATIADTVFPAPIAGVITGGDTVCESDTLHLADVVPGGTWSSSNTIIASVTSSGVVSGLSTGWATITYSVTNPCGAATVTHSVYVKALIDCDLKVKPAADNPACKVYPNPSAETFTVELPSPVQQATITVTDMLGKVTTSFQAKAGSNTIKLDNAAPGSYLIRIDANGNTYREKIQVIK